MPDTFHDPQMDAERAEAAAWFRTLRDEIVAAFEALETVPDLPGADGLSPGRFEVTPTVRRAEDGSDAGGGLMSVLREGRVFEKVGVNWSEVHGTLGDRAQAASGRRARTASARMARD